MYEKKTIKKILPEKFKEYDIIDIIEIDEGIELNIYLELSNSKTIMIKAHDTEWYDSDRGFLAGPHLMRKVREKDRGIPVPKVYSIVNEYGGDFPSPYYVMEYIENSNISYEELSHDRKVKFLKKAAKNLARINKLEVDTNKVGYLKYSMTDEVIKGEEDSVEDFIINRLESFSKDIEEGGFMIGEDSGKGRFTNKVEKINKLIDLIRHNSFLECNNYSYCHWDYRFNNILVKNSNIVGIVDWEVPIVCDKMYNLARAEEKLCRGEENEDVLLNTMRKEYMNNIDEEINVNDTKMLIYIILQIIEAMRNFDAWFKEYNEKERAAYEKEYNKRFNDVYRRIE